MCKTIAHGKNEKMRIEIEEKQRNGGNNEKNEASKSN
jgi:hypothetical protein